MNRSAFFILSVIFLTSCFASKMEDLKSIENYSSENVRINSKKVVDAEITFLNGETVKTKLQASKHLNGKLDEASVSQYFAIYDKDGKRVFLRNKVVKNMRFLDYEGNERIFVNRDNHPKALQELVYDGKVKWYIEYTYKGIGNIDVFHFFIDEKGKEIKIYDLKFDKKFKEFVSSKFDIEKVNKYNTLEIIEILKKYENL